MIPLLNSQLLRRITYNLRIEHPVLYAGLHQVRRRLAAGRSTLELYQHLAFERLQRAVPLRGARVLEVGSDLDMKVLKLLAEKGAASAVGVNNDEEFWRARESDHIDIPPRVRFQKGDARRLPFDDASFDAIFSVATFEHLHDLPVALAEMHRVLKPGGVVVSYFGPIWSSCKGHHVWQDGAQHSQPEKSPLPDFSHLLLSPEELRASLRKWASPGSIEPIVAGVYGSPVINRLFYADYVRSFRSSPFTIVSMRTDSDPVNPQLERLLRFKFPEEDRFDATNIEVTLKKREVST